MTPAAIAALMTAAAALIGALYAISKRRPEMAEVLVTSASAVVIMQRDALAESDRRIHQLEEHSKVQDAAIEALRAEVAALASQRDEAVDKLDEVVRERDLLLRANEEMQVVNNDLESRVSYLEGEVRRLGGVVPPHPP